MILSARMSIDNGTGSDLGVGILIDIVICKGVTIGTGIGMNIVG